MTHRETDCKRCGESCSIEDEYPKAFAWCDNCNDYARDFLELNQELLENMIDAAELLLEPER